MVVTEKPVEAMQLAEQLATAKQYLSSNPAQAYQLAQEIQQVAADCGDTQSEATSLQIMARVYQFQADYRSAVQTASRALELYRQLASETQTVETLGILAAIYAQMTDFRQALAYFEQQLVLFKQLNDTPGLAVCLTSIGGIYVSLEQYTPALERYEQALVLVQNLEKPDPATLAFVLNGLGFTYLKIEQPDQALNYLQQAYTAVAATTNQRRAASIDLALGEAYRQLGRFEEALKFLQEGYQLFERLGDTRGLVGALLEMGKLYQEAADFEQSATCYQRGLQIAEETDNLDGSYHLHEGLATLYEKQGNLAAALYHYKEFARRKSEVNNRDNQRSLAATQTRFELEKSEQEREIYRRHNLELAELLQQLETANVEITNLNEQLKSENLRMNAELDITRRLQQMILPSTAELAQIEGYEVAAFMQPAQEVGGDYYDLFWQPNDSDKLYLGVGDVTGHGLESGVVMLMVQTAFSTLLRHPETNLKTILATLNRTIYANTQRMNSDKNLSLVLASLDPQSGCLRLSGQHEEVIILRHTGQLERIDTFNLGFSVGLLDDIGEFIDQIEVQLETGDVVVFYTDGITEAENANKELYGIERLCAVLEANRHASAEALKQSVIADVFEHIGNSKVFDDVTLLIVKKS